MLPVSTINSGRVRRISVERLSTAETTEVVMPAASSNAFSRTAGSTSASVMRTVAPPLRAMHTPVFFDAPTQNVTSMLDDWGEYRESVTHSADRSGQIDYQGSPPNSGDTTRQNRARKTRRIVAHLIHKAGRLSSNHRTCRLRCHVALGQTSPASRHHKLAIAVVASVKQRADDIHRFVCNGHAGGNRVTTRDRPNGDAVPERVRPSSAGDWVRNGDDGKLQRGDAFL